MNITLRRTLAVVSLVLLSFHLVGCVAFAPLIKTYSEIGVSRSDRMQLLEPRLKEFYNAVYWGKGYEALSYASDESRDDLQRYLRRLRKNKRRVVESSIEFVDFNEDAYEAEVEVLVRFYEEPFYIVKDQTEKQKWEFETAVGWKFVSREDVKADSIG